MDVLKNKQIWVCWNRKAFEETGDRIHKKPLNPHTGRNAQSNNPATWGTFTQATTAATRMGGGVGFMFTDNICGIDIDIKGDPELIQQAKKILAHMNTYSEYSPSGDGYHIIFTCDLTKIPQKNGKLDPAYYQKNPNNKLECYFAGLTNRYFTYTGEAVNSEDVTDQTTQVLEFLKRYMQKESRQKLIENNQPLAVPKSQISTNLQDTDILSIARKARNRSKFIALFDNGDISGHKDDHSSADIALCNMLAFYSNGDPLIIDRLFRQSALYRDKWERLDYRANTIDKAIAQCGGKYYTPPKPKAPKKERPPKPNPLDSKPLLNQINPFDDPSRYTWDALGLRLIFADTYKNVSRYVPEAKEWYNYNGKVWSIDTGGMKVQQQAVDLMEHLMDCRKLLTDERERQSWVEFVAYQMKKISRNIVIEDAKSVYPVSITDFDKDPYLLNCQNCTLDLKTMKISLHNPDHLLTKITGAAFDRRANCGRWSKFIDEVMQGDKDKIKFLQKALGYTLIGDTSQECFFILYGNTTRNGKGTMMETTLHLLGSYGRTAQPETIAYKQNTHSGAPTEDIARLKGARFVNMSEPDKGLRLNAALVKQLTGGDTVTARFLHQNSFEYRPEYKLFINTNHLPLVTDDTIFASGRVKLISFERHFNENEQDKGLKDHFKQPDNMSGILNWYINGLKFLMSEGLKQPKPISDAINKYREDSNPVSQFVAENLIIAKHEKVLFREVYTAYSIWCDSWGYSALNRRNFANELRKKGMEARNATGNQIYLMDCKLTIEESEMPKEWP